jgi:hypothetical protein
MEMDLMSRTQHIADFIEDRARTDSGYAIAYAILQLADAQRRLLPRSIWILSESAWTWALARLLMPFEPLMGDPLRVSSN